MDAWMETVKALLAVPGVGLGGLFASAFLSATLLPLGSEVVLYGVLAADRGAVWPALAVATLGNTLGGAVTWWMGRGAGALVDRVVDAPQAGPHARSRAWLVRHGAKACLLAWLPVVGDPLCGVAGWLRLPFWPCVLYMAVGKGLRYGLLCLIFLGGMGPA